MLQQVKPRLKCVTSVDKENHHSLDLCFKPIFIDVRIIDLLTRYFTHNVKCLMIICFLNFD